MVLSHPTPARGNPSLTAPTGSGPGWLTCRRDTSGCRSGSQPKAVSSSHLVALWRTPRSGIGVILIAATTLNPTTDPAHTPVAAGSRTRSWPGYGRHRSSRSPGARRTTRAAAMDRCVAPHPSSCHDDMSAQADPSPPGRDLLSLPSFMWQPVSPAPHHGSTAWGSGERPGSRPGPRTRGWRATPRVRVRRRRPRTRACA